MQLDDRFFKLDQETKPQLQQELMGRNLIAFNSTFEQIHLAREGFEDIWENQWIDVSLLAKLMIKISVETGIIGSEKYWEALSW